MDDRIESAAPTLREIAGIMGGRLYVPVPALGDGRITGVCSDTRRIEEGNLFVAISGERYDGHDFVPEAMRSGACASLVSADWHDGRPDRDAPDGARIVVPDVIPALQTFAGWHRSRYDLPVVAVTGSNGKTTTKNMIASVLSERYRVFKTPGNLNSQLGVSEALFSLREDHGAAVLELGMNRAGELNRLARMTRPSVGVITNVGPAHIEFFDSIEGIARAKGEILDHLPPDGRAVLNADDPLVMKQAGRSQAQVVTFGRGEGADVRLACSRTELSGSTFALSDGAAFRTNLMGEHQVMNAVAAVAVGRHFGIDDIDIARALRRVGPTPMRMEYTQMGDVHLINDAYNANPASMKAALDALATTKGRRLAVLGDMLELGESGRAAHRKVGKHAAGVVDRIITVGDLARDIAEAAVVEGGLPAGCVVRCSSNAEAADAVLAGIRDGDVILVKGSRGMRMETIVESMATALCRPAEG